MHKILVADDDVTFGLILERYLTKKGYQVITTEHVDKAIEAFHEHQPSLILSDYRMPGKDGIEFLKYISAQQPTPFIIMTSHGDIRLAVHAMKLGAYDYITKPVNPDELLELVREAISSAGSSPDNTSKNTSARAVIDHHFVQGESEVWKEVNQHIELVGPTPLSVLIQGESGTGKEFAAARLHELSDRAGQAFVAIDCGALSNDIAASELFGHVKGAFTGAATDKKGSIEEADKGTLFLDEIGNLSYEIQVKLLRALQEKKIRRVGSTKDKSVDIRIIAATNEQLKSAVERGEFREDLYHRLNEFKIELPPLRARKEDILLFARHFIDQANSALKKQVKDMSPEVKEKLLNYHWPGNLRELKNVIKRAVLLSRSTIIEVDNLPSELRHTEQYQDIAFDKATDLKSLSEQMEKQKITEVLQQVRYNKAEAARLLNIDRKTLYNKLKTYQLDF